MEFFDTHTHLATEAFQSDLEETLERARSTGTGRWIAIGAGEGIKSNHEALSLSHRIMDVWATVGIHPHDAKIWNEKVREELRDLSTDPKVRAWGEIGLDFHYMNSEKEIQIKAFEEQIEIAKECNLPLILHTREAEEETLGLLTRNREKIKALVFHCFSGDLSFSKKIRDLDAYIGVGGIVTFRAAQSLREAVGHYPLERILLETDCPYLAPVPHRGKRNEPAYIPLIAQKIAELKGSTPDEIARVTTQNALRLFGL